MTPFEKAFASARSAKKATFDFNGKKYSTQLKGEAAGATQRPADRPANQGPAGAGNATGAKKPVPTSTAAKSTTPSSPRPKARPTATEATKSSAPAASPRPKAKPTTAATDAGPKKPSNPLYRPSNTNLGAGAAPKTAPNAKPTPKPSSAPASARGSREMPKPAANTKSFGSKVKDFFAGGGLSGKWQRERDAKK